MRVTDSSIRALYQESLRPGGLSGGCVDAQDAAAAALAQLEPARSAALADHLAGCLDCARDFRVAVALRPLQAEARGLFSRRRAWWPVAVAASVTIALLSLGWMHVSLRKSERTIARLQDQIARSQRAPAAAATPRADDRTIAELQRTVAALSRPYAGMGIFDLDAVPTRGAGRIAPLNVPAGTALFTLILHLPAQWRPESVGIDIVDERGAVLWSGQAEADHETSTLSLTLHRSAFSGGDYSVRARVTGGEAIFHFRLL